MKTKKLFLAALATLAFASCVNDEFVGDNSPTALGNGAISFGFNLQNATRGAQTHTASAATLHNQFVVWGEKSASTPETGSAGTPVFINYVVNYGASSAGSSESNIADWEYVGQTPYADTKVVASAAPTAVTQQTIKYWDFTNKYYTFTAFSALPADISGDKVIVTKNVSGTTAYDKGYTMAVKADASINDIYFADRELVTAATATKATAVQLDFRSLVSKVRFGFYETIPGYSVKITDVKFNSGASHTSDGENKFGVDGLITVPGNTTTFTVTYDNGSEIAANENKAKVVVSTPNTQGYLSTTATSFFGTTLGTASNNPLWENDGDFTTFLPNTENITDLTLTISYTLTSTDGSGETIDITDATAKVPAAYAKWQSNYAYTYLFKISDNTNGSAGQEIIGLYPITFDAVVVEDEAGNQETITTVSTPSITTYAEGEVVTAKNEYLTGGNIYVTVDKAGTVQTLTVGTNANLYIVTNNTGVGSATQEITEESVANALAHGTPSDGSEPADGVNDTWTVTGVGMKNLVVTALNVPTLTATTKIDKADSPTGVDITVNGAKFTPTAAGTYVFEFIDTADGDKKYYKIIKVVAS